MIALGRTATPARWEGLRTRQTTLRCSLPVPEHPNLDTTQGSVFLQYSPLLCPGSYCCLILVCVCLSLTNRVLDSYFQNQHNFKGYFYKFKTEYAILSLQPELPV